MPLWRAPCALRVSVALRDSAPSLNRLSFGLCSNGTGFAIPNRMPNSKNTFSMQIVRPTRMQAWVFVAGCGLSSMFGAAATAMSQGATTVNTVSFYESNYPDSSATHRGTLEQLLPRDCHDMTVHTAVPKAEIIRWLSAPRSEPRFVVVSDVGVPPSLRIESIVSGSLFERMGLRGGDTIHSVLGIPVLSPHSTDRMLEALVSQAPETLSVSFTRDRCPMNLELFPL